MGMLFHCARCHINCHVVSDYDLGQLDCCKKSTKDGAVAIETVGVDTAMSKSLGMDTTMSKSPGVDTMTSRRGYSDASFLLHRILHQKVRNVENLHGKIRAFVLVSNSNRDDMLYNLRVICFKLFICPGNHIFALFEKTNELIYFTWRTTLSQIYISGFNFSSQIY